MAELALDRITRDPHIQQRAGGITPARVREYTKAMRAGDPFPPVVVFDDGETYWLADGFHRCAAAALAARAAIEVDIRQGSRREALLYAAGANVAHGMRRTNADKRTAVLTLLQDEEWRHWSDHEIARRTHTTQPFVSTLRRLRTGGETPTLRKSADGRTMDTGKIGKRQGAKEPASSLLQLRQAWNTASEAERQQWVAEHGQALCACLEEFWLTRSVPEGEHKQVTVLCCALVNATAPAERLEPEAAYTLVHRFFALALSLVSRYGGSLSHVLSDGFMALFGAPVAHEDNAQRAVRAGLELVEGVGQLSPRLEQPQGVRLAVRVGVHTGAVVVGTLGGAARPVQVIVGEAPTLAAELHALAAPNTVVLSATTCRLVEDAFACQALPVSPHQDRSQPIAGYRVLSARAGHTPTRLTPLVGRDQELGLLRERWEHVKEGRGQVVVLSGEAGIGKSRLVQELKDHVAREPHTWFECHCSPYHQNSALYPVIDLLQRVLGVRRDESADEQLRTLETALAQWPRALDETVPLLAALLSVPLGTRYPPLTLSPERQKRQTLEVLLAVVWELARQRPVLIVVESLHWVDPSTLDLLTLLIEQGPMAHLFLLLTCRPEFRLPWGIRAPLTSLTLSRLLPTQVAVMVERVTGGKALPAEVRQHVIAKTDGVPLFVEELTKMVLESGWLQERDNHYELREPLPPLAIPETLHDSLMARLDHLKSAKAVAQLGATLGRHFPYEVLKAVSSLDEATLQRALGALVQAELLYQRGLLPHATYTFKHALIQEAAYQSLLRRTRQQYHRQIAQVLAAQFPETVATQPELLAQHYTEAGLTEPAVEAWHQAGERAVKRSDHAEAVSLLRQGLAVLETLPDTLERAQGELRFRITLGESLAATKGFASPDVAATYTRVRALCQQLGETPQHPGALWGLWRFALLRGELQEAQALGAQLLHVAQHGDDLGLRLGAHFALGAPLFYRGEFSAAYQCVEQGLALYDPERHRYHDFLYCVTDPGVFCHSYAALTRWLLGYPDQALTRIQTMVTLAQQLSHPSSLAYALSYAAVVHQLRGDGAAAQQQAEAAITLATEQSFALWLAMGMFLRGWALAAQGQHEAGIVQMRQGVTAWEATGAGLARPYWYALLAEASGKGGHAAEGLDMLAQARAVMDDQGQRFFEAELHRLQGELLLTLSTEHHPEAETCFRQALDVARRQEAKSLELRAAMSLSRLWQGQSRLDEACQLLTEVYGWFTEGFDTPDLQEAQALLEALTR